MFNKVFLKFDSFLKYQSYNMDFTIDSLFIIILAIKIFLLFQEIGDFIAFI